MDGTPSRRILVAEGLGSCFIRSAFPLRSSSSPGYRPRDRRRAWPGRAPVPRKFAPALTPAVPPHRLARLLAGNQRQRSSSPRYHFVDCRWELGSPGRGRELYLEGHIPGASFLDVDEDLADQTLEGGGRNPLPRAERFAERAGRAGIGDGVFVVAYGSMGGAERLWGLLRHFGHDDRAVRAGGGG